MGPQFFRQVLAIETSCDDTSVAIVSHDGYVSAVCSANQDLAHAPFGGVVPEIAGRNHTLNILPLVEACLAKAHESWEGIDGIVVTSRPGLLGSLLVGLVTAKTFSLTKEIPFLGVNHLEGHILAPFLRDELYEPPSGFEFPFIALAVSGGHTHLYLVRKFGSYHVLGQTIDDAAGEAFDKLAKMLQIGFPGGAKVDQWALGGDAKAFDFPRPMLRDNSFKMSFSGLKTAAHRLIKEMSKEDRQAKRSDLCASYQEAICDVLIGKLDRAIHVYGCRKVVITGGVSANSRLRVRGKKWAQQNNCQLVVPPIHYCTDNAAMIGYAGIQRLNNGEVSEQNHPPSPHVAPGDFIYEVPT